MIVGLHHQGIQVLDLEKATNEYQQMDFEVEKEFERADLFARAAHLRYPQGGRLELWEFGEAHPDHEFIQNHTAFLVTILKKICSSLSITAVKL